jgi:hypothetical protein
MLPAGDPARFIRVDLKLFAGGKVIETRSPCASARNGGGGPKDRKLGDNRLKPLEERVETVEFRVAHPATLRVTLYNCRLSEQNARYHNLIGRYPLEAQVMELPRYRIE